MIGVLLAQPVQRVVHHLPRLVVVGDRALVVVGREHFVYSLSPSSGSNTFLIFASNWWQSSTFLSSSLGSETNGSSLLSGCAQRLRRFSALSKAFSSSRR